MVLEETTWRGKKPGGKMVQWVEAPACKSDDLGLYCWISKSWQERIDSQNVSSDYTRRLFLKLFNWSVWCSNVSMFMCVWACIHYMHMKDRTKCQSLSSLFSEAGLFTEPGASLLIQTDWLVGAPGILQSPSTLYWNRRGVPEALTCPLCLDRYVYLLTFPRW